jgi:hypothetical protein
MASGHVNRIYRPNTWQHRPSLRREDFSCQPGAVHTWHFSDVTDYADDVRSWGKPFVPLDGTTGIFQKNAKHCPTL